MLILDKPRVLRDNHLYLPLYHRGPLSLFPDGRVSVCFLPKISAHGLSTELIISPAPFNSWGDLWRINITLNDRIGLVSDVFAVLGQRGLNVVSAESSSMERQHLHKVEIVVDATRYSSAHGDGTHEDRASGQVEGLRYLEMEMLSVLLPDIAFLPTGEPRFRVDRMWNLFHAHTDYSRACQQADRGAGPLPAVTTAFIVKRLSATSLFTLPRSRVCVDLPDAMIKQILNVVNDGPQAALTSPPKYLLVSDTNERMLRVHVFDAKRVLVCPTVVHVDKEGACAAITARLRSAQFNILTSLSRLHKHGAVGTTEFVLEAPPGCKSEARATELLQAALATARLDEEFNVSVDCDHRYGESLRTVRLHASADEHLDSASTDVPRVTSGFEVLQGHIERYARRLHSGFGEPNDEKRVRLAQTLAGQLTLADAVARKHVLFVSFAFKDADRFQVLCDQAEALGLEVVTGANLRGASLTKKELVQRIDCCTSFLGVWTEDGAIHAEGKYWPSPWLHWELGAAYARGLRCRLLVTESIAKDAWHRIMGETQQEVFRHGEFSTKCQSLLRRIREDLDHQGN